MYASPAFDEAYSLDDPDIAHPKPLHDRPRGAVVNLRERDDRHVGLVPGGPPQRRPTELRRVATTGATVADCPAEFKHRFVVEVDASEAAAADK